MRNQFGRPTAWQIATLAFVAALVSCTVAFADNTTATLTPVVNGDTGSAISTPLDTQTQAFRDQLSAKEADLAALKSQLASMSTDAEIADQAYDQALDQLQQITGRVDAATSELASAQAAYDMQAEILGERASSIYKDGTLSGVEVLLNSKSFGDFVARVKFLNTVGLADAQTANSLRAQRELLDQQLTTLKASQEQAQAAEFQLKARKIEMELRVQERQQTLANAETDLQTMLNSEASRRQTQETALMADVLAGANKAGIVVQAGSPVETALAYHGVPYVWGGATPSGFDCSGLVMYTFAQHGVTLPHYSGSQFQMGLPIDLSAIQPNDVVFFGNPVHHVGIYCGGGYFIEAPYTGSYVRITKLSTRNDIAGVRRYPWVTRVGAPKGAVTDATSALKSVK
jgi:cell wall-associated NlpC family hydrolase